MWYQLSKIITRTSKSYRETSWKRQRWFSGLIKVEVSSGHTCPLIRGPPRPPNRSASPPQLRNMNLPLPQNLAILGTSSHRVPRRWKFVYSDKALHHCIQGNPVLKTRGGFYENPITHPTYSDVTSSTVFNHKAKWLTNDESIAFETRKYQTLSPK